MEWNWEKLEKQKNTYTMLVVSSVLFFQSSRSTLDKAPKTGSTNKTSKLINFMALLRIFQLLLRLRKTCKYYTFKWKNTFQEGPDMSNYVVSHKYKRIPERSMTLQQTICWLKIQEDFFKKKFFFQLSDKSGPRSYGFLLLFYTYHFQRVPLSYQDFLKAVV